MIFVISTIHVKPGSQEQILAAAKACIAETVKEQGCIGYDLHHSVTQPEKFVFVERWESRDNLASHVTQPHFQVWRAAANPLIVERNIEVITPQSVTGL